MEEDGRWEDEDAAAAAARDFLRRRRQKRERRRIRIRAARPPRTPPTIAPTLVFEEGLGEVEAEGEMSRVAARKPVGATRPRYVRRLSLSKPSFGAVSVAPPAPLRKISCAGRIAYSGYAVPATDDLCDIWRDGVVCEIRNYALGQNAAMSSGEKYRELTILIPGNVKDIVHPQIQIVLTPDIRDVAGIVGRVWEPASHEHHLAFINDIAR